MGIKEDQFISFWSIKNSGNAASNLWLLTGKDINCRPLFNHRNVEKHDNTRENDWYKAQNLEQFSVLTNFINLKNYQSRQYKKQKLQIYIIILLFILSIK